jgi:hypothetical protein
MLWTFPSKWALCSSMASSCSRRRFRLSRARKACENPGLPVMRRALAAFLPAVIAAATACATPARVVFSRRVRDADTTPRRVLILSRLAEGGGPSFGPVFAKAFEGRLDAALRRCGMHTTGYSSTGLETEDELDRPGGADWIDAVVIVRMSHGAVDQFGALLNGTVEVTLLGGTVGLDGRKAVRQKPKLLWSGAAIFAYTGLGFPAMAAKAEAFADDLSNKMKEDGFFPGCPRVGPRDLPAVVSPVESGGYAPATRLAASGGLSISAVSYMPAQLAQARTAEARRFDGGPNTAVNNAPARSYPRFGPDRDQLSGEGRTRFSPGVDEYLRGVLGAELRRMGIDTAEPRRLLRCDIKEGNVDGTSWGYRVSLRVKYELTEPGTGRVLYSDVKSVGTSPSAAPMLEADALDQAIRASAEALVQDPEFAGAIR